MNRPSTAVLSVFTFVALVRLMTFFMATALGME